MHLIVTGSSGRLGRVLVPYLLSSGAAETVTGIDTRPSPYHLPGYRHHLADVCNPNTRALFKGKDALVHLAFVLMGGGLGRRRHQREVIRRINLEGSQRIFEAALDAGLQHAVFVSSAAVYGSWPDNPPALAESDPMRPMKGFAYQEDKIAVERWLEDFACKHPALAITRLRPHVILGENAHPLLNGVLRQPIYPFVHPHPLSQCIWEQDVARAIMLVLKKRIPGVFNLAASPPMSLYEMLGLVRHRRIPLPLPVLNFLHRLAWRLTPAVGDPGWTQGLRYPLVLDTRQSRAVLGFTPEYSVPDCVRHAATGWRGEQP